MASRKTKLLALGTSSTLAGLLLAASFQFISDHRWYWNTAPLLCMLVLLGTVFGGFLVGRSLAGARNTCLWVVMIGALLGFLWLATGILAAVLGALLGLIFLSRSYAVGGVTVVVCALFSVLELFVAFLQAYIFTFLATLFIAAAVRPQH